MSHHSHPVFDGFLTLWVFNPKKQFPLGNYELLLYSALAQAEALAKRTTNTDLAFQTGLNRNSINGMLERLSHEGFVRGERTPVDRPEFFLSADRRKKVEHWSQRLRFWKCLVRRQSSKLKVKDQCVLSYVWWSQVTGFEPPHGWSAPYLAQILKISKKTVRDAIRRLGQMCLMEVTDNQWRVPDDLSLIQADWFIRKSDDFVVKEKVTLGTFTPDIRKLADGYAPGEVLGATTPASPHRPVDSLSVLQYIGEVVNGQRCDMASRNRIVETAKPELRVVGTEGDDWKPIVERHVRNWMAEQEPQSVVPNTSDCSERMSDKELLKSLQASGLI